MARMRDRNRFPPGGWRFIQPQIPRFGVVPWSSFDSMVNQIVAVRLANPRITNEHQLSVDPAVVAGELDAFNAKVCAEMKWTDYIWEGGGEPPGSPKVQSLLTRLKQSAVRVAEGSQTILEWEMEGGELVPDEQSESRSKVCVACPKNEVGDLTSWFTVPASELIKKQLEARNQRKIRTSVDPLLGVCQACSCPLKLMVHVPLEIKLKHMRPEDKASLHPACWVLKEENEIPKTGNAAR